MKGKYSPYTYLAPLYDGSETEIIIGLKEARIEKGNRFAVGITRAFSKGVIVVNLDAESYLEFKNKIGFGKLILDMGSGAGIEYILLQNSKEILAANKNVDELSNFANDDLLVQIGNENEVFRINVFNNEKERVFSNAGNDSIHQSMKGKYSPDTYLAPLYDGSETEIIIAPASEPKIPKRITRYIFISPL